jgi:hypothetical protein
LLKVELLLNRLILFKKEVRNESADYKHVAA